MTKEGFEIMRKRVIREYKYLIVRSALRGHKNKGRGMVLLKCNPRGMVHLSYLTLETLKQHYGNACPEDRNSGKMVIRKISMYRPDCEVPVMVTNGVIQKLSFGVRQPA
jgi:hypothetical protein